MYSVRSLFPMEDSNFNVDENGGCTSTDITRDIQTPNGEVESTVTMSSPAMEKPVLMCRICYCGPSSGILLRPCKCKGSIEFVHRRCLERWLKMKKTVACELCHHRFTTRRIPKSWWDWSSRDIENILPVTSICICLLLALFSWALVICLSSEFLLRLVFPVVFTVFFLMSLMSSLAKQISADWIRFSTWRRSNFYLHVVIPEGNDEPSTSVDASSTSEDASFASEDEPSASEDESSASEDESSASEDDSSASGNNSSASEDDSSASEDDSSASGNNSSASEDDSSASEDDSSASEDDSSASGVSDQLSRIISTLSPSYFSA